MSRVPDTTRSALQAAKWCHATRRVEPVDVAGLDTDPTALVPGDLLLVEVDRIRQHRRIQLRDGSYSRLFSGDRIVLAAGDRFATDQFIGTTGVRADRSLDLLAGGGVAGLEQRRHGAVKPATRLRLHGRLLDDRGEPLRLERYALDPGPGGRPETVFCVIGTGMNAGKSDAAAGLVNGLVRLGFRVGAIKATGTASFGDTQLYRAAGASPVHDFTDIGMASTYRQPLADIERGLLRLLAECAEQRCDVVVVELADGVAEAETAELIAAAGFRALVDGILLAAGDALAAEAALLRLGERGHRPLALTGLITRGLTVSGEGHHALPVLDRDDLADPATASALLQRLRQRPVSA